MTDIYKITLNMNGLASQTRLEMLEEFLRKQEKTLHSYRKLPNLNTLNRYAAYINEGTERRGSTILAREGTTLTNRLPSGRGIAAMYHGIWLVNIYAPSGAAGRNERQTFYNSDLTYLLPAAHSEMILVGDFRCVLSNTDCTGQRNYSRALDSSVRGFNLTDVCEATPPRSIYYHYIPTGA